MQGAVTTGQLGNAPRERRNRGTIYMASHGNTTWRRSLWAGTVLSSAVAATFMGGAAAHAQSAGGSDGGIRLDTITVTAERREMSLQETPISILAFSSENMELKGV